MQLDPAVMPQQSVYKLLIGCVVPRPIAWVSTVSADGVHNLAPFSFFMGVCNEPPTIAFSSSRREGNKKDTVTNAEHTGDFVVNVVDDPLAEHMNLTSGEYPPEVDEFAVTGLTAAPGVKVRAPRLAEAPISLECRRRPDHPRRPRTQQPRHRRDRVLPRARRRLRSLHGPDRHARAPPGRPPGRESLLAHPRHLRDEAAERALRGLSVTSRGRAGSEFPLPRRGSRVRVASLGRRVAVSWTAWARAEGSRPARPRASSRSSSAVLLHGDRAHQRHLLVEDDGGQRGHAEPGDGLGVVVQHGSVRLAAGAVGLEARHVETARLGQAPQHVGPADVEVVPEVRREQRVMEGARRIRDPGARRPWRR